MAINRTLGLLALAVTSFSSGTNALAQPIVGGMGEPVQLGAFNAHGESRFTGRNPAVKPSPKARRPRDTGMPVVGEGHAKPTLPGKHLR